MGYLDNYLASLREAGKTELANAVEKTANDIVPQYISNFSYQEHVTALLVGEVQSGKTSHMFGLICAAADNDFGNFILLTSDINLLAEQTLERAKKDLSEFCICGAHDYLAFLQNNMRKPAVIVLKKNSNELKQWKNNLAGTSFCRGNPLFIVDDEADAASLNTMVNKNKQSTINKRLEEIRKTSSSSIYLEVTGTPQAIFLQSVDSNWKPYFVYYFKPGRNYLGGDFYFPSEVPPYIRFTDNEEATDILADDEFPENGLKSGLIVHLLTSAQLFLEGKKVSNFLIHPSYKTEDHGKFANKVGAYLNEMAHSMGEPTTRETFAAEFEDLKKTKTDLRDFSELYSFIINVLKNDAIQILVLNSKSSYEDSKQYEQGINILVGGNSLGRGITFPQLQTVYYCRVSKNPQADTMWQHARMFGYDRDPALVRVFMPPRLYKLFSDINGASKNMAMQMLRGNGNPNIKVRYPVGLRPTRKQVIDTTKVGIYSGGVNYFPFEPANNTIQAIDNLLSSFEDGDYSVSIKLIIKLIEMISSKPEDWNAQAFAGLVNSAAIEIPLAQGRLIIRRNRDIGKGTGTLLSPTDRELGDKYPDDVVLTMYKITGTKEGWNGQQLWIPNIKLPGNEVYYSGDHYGG